MAFTEYLKASAQYASLLVQLVEKAESLGVKVELDAAESINFSRDGMVSWSLRVRPSCDESRLMTELAYLRQWMSRLEALKVEIQLDSEYELLSDPQLRKFHCLFPDAVDRYIIVRKFQSMDAEEYRIYESAAKRQIMRVDTGQ